MEKKDGWFALKSCVYVAFKEEKILLYDTQSGNRIETESKDAISLVSQLYEPKNLGVTLLSKEMQMNPGVSPFVCEVLEKRMGDVTDVEKIPNKPVQLIPILNLQKDVERLKKNEENYPLIGNNAKNYLMELNIYLNNSCSLNSYLAHGHEFHLYTYTNISNTPNGAIVKDANSIIPEKEVFIDCFGSYANLANQFRLALLYKSGGWWVDMDTVCLKPFDFDEDFVFSSEISGYHKPRYLVNNTYIKSKSQAKFLKDCLVFISYRGHEHIHWGELGVNLLSRMIFRNNMEQYIKHPNCFCPVTYYDFDYLIGEKTGVLPETAYALHWWNELWRRNGIDKNAKYPENSLYEIMKRKYNR